MKVSVIIPSYNGANKVVNLLAALEKQNYRNFEVIVVVDGSTDGTAEKLKKSQYGLELRLIERPNGGRAVARNTGAKAAQGELLLFFDDDIRPIDRCVHLHVLHHQAFPGTAVVGHVPEDKEKMRTDFQRYKAWLSRKWSEPLLENGGWLSKENIFITAANFSIAKSVFFELNGFDERLRDIEDYELALRVSEKNIPVFYHQQAIGWHDDFITCRSYIRRQREYSIAIQHLRDILSSEQRHATALENSRSPWKKYAYSLFCHRFSVYSIDHLNVYQFLLPSSVRYQLYDIVTWGLARYYPGRKI